MSFLADESYLAAQVKTASPQRLRLMLIDGALRLAHRTGALWQAANFGEATEPMLRCQDIVCELLQSPNKARAPELVDKVQGLYLFVHSSLVAAQRARDESKLNDAIRILEIERETWRQVCAELDTTAVPSARFDTHVSAAERFSAEA